MFIDSVKNTLLACQKQLFSEQAVVCHSPLNELVLCWLVKQPMTFTQGRSEVTLEVFSEDPGPDHQTQQ